MVGTLARLSTQIRLAAGLLALAFMIAMASPVLAQQPNSVDPSAAVVPEAQLLKELNKIQGLGSIPDKKSYVLEHPAGREWREFRTVTLKWIGGIAIIGMVLVLAIFYLWRGPMRVKAGYSGVKILRFDVIERFTHWLTASTFIVLGLTGLNISFGRSLLLPILGLQAFSTWSEAAKYAHNYLSFAFTIGVAIMFLMWLGRNFPTQADVTWVKQAGGMFDKDDSTHAPAYKFNAGQKMLFWLIMMASAAMIVTGFMLLFPFYYGLNIGDMELAEVFHGVVGMLFVSLIIAHIYLGTLGMQGAFEAMSQGTVDVNWAKEHHNLWYAEEVQGGAKGGVKPAMRPAE